MLDVEKYNNDHSKEIYIVNKIDILNANKEEEL